MSTMRSLAVSIATAMALAATTSAAGTPSPWHRAGVAFSFGNYPGFFPTTVDANYRLAVHESIEVCAGVRTYLVGPSYGAIADESMDNLVGFLAGGLRVNVFQWWVRGSRAPERSALYVQGLYGTPRILVHALGENADPPATAARIDVGYHRTAYSRDVLVGTGVYVSYATDIDAFVLGFEADVGFGWR